MCSSSHDEIQALWLHDTAPLTRTCTIVGRHAIETAQPEASIEGVNGGADGKQAEFQNEDFLQRFDDKGDPPKTNGCESMGVGGCEPAAEGGVKPVDAVRALDDFAAIGVISKKNVPTLREFVDFDQAGNRLEAGASPCMCGVLTGYASTTSDSCRDTPVQVLVKVHWLTDRTFEMC